MKKKSIGILGTGAVAYRWYLKGLCGIKDNYEVKVICDIREDIVKQTAKDFNVKEYCTDFNDLFNYDLDLIVVLTRHEDHYNHIKTILNKGINVYSEKPFAENYIDGKELYELALEKKVVFGSAPQIMFSSRNNVVKDFIDEGKLGKVTYIRASGSNMGPAGRKDTNYDPEWFYNSGGSLKSLGIYTLSILIWIIGMPKKISSFMGVALPEREVKYGPFAGKQFKVKAYDNVTALFDFGDSTHAVFDGSYSMANQSKNELEIHGEKGSLYVSGFGGPESVIYKDLEGKEFQVGPNDDCHLKWNLSWGVEDTINAIIEKREPKANSEFALNVIKVMDLMEESSKNGEIKIIN